MQETVEPASFRDPSGFVYRDSEGRLLRQVNRVYEEDFNRLIRDGLYEQLVGDRLLIEHDDVDVSYAAAANATRVIAPRELGFISYPYEWSFSALKDAALLTLDIQLRSMQVGMSLKDASAYNVQFEGGKPIFIDTLSFESYEADAPWVAYSQFCRHFLAPLALMARTDISLGQMLKLDVDGVALDVASKLLPMSTKFSMGLMVHLHTHAKMVKRYAKTGEGASKPKKPRMSRTALEALLQNLRSTIEKLQWEPTGTQWADYYQDNSYSSAEFEAKKQIVEAYLSDQAPGTVWDLGANTGVFSRLAASKGITTLSFDIDPACVEMNYQQAKRDNSKLLLPLLLDLGNPSPALGWDNRERMSLGDRGPADSVMALALIHHLAITNNVPFGRQAEFFAGVGRQLIIEYVPKSDPQSQRLLESREDVFADYTQDVFEAAFQTYFRIDDRKPVSDGGRILYAMTRTSERRS